MLKQERASPNCYHNVGNTELSRMSLRSVALRFPFTGTKGPSLNCEKQLVLCIGAGSDLLAPAKPRFVCRTAKRCSVIITTENEFPLLLVSNGGELYTTQGWITWRSRSVSLCGLPLHGWAAVAPRCFHFTITTLTVDRDSSSRVEIWRADLLERWHPMKVPHWKSLSSSVRPF